MENWIFEYWFEVFSIIFVEFNIDDFHPFISYKFHENYDGLLSADFLNTYGLNLNFENQTLYNDCCAILFEYPKVCHDPIPISVDSSHPGSDIM